MTDASPASRESVCAKQIGQLRTLLRTLRPDNAFYENKLGPAGIDENIGSLEEFSARCPLTTKDELVVDQAGHPPYGSNLTFPLKQYTRLHQTSGTTGHPLNWLDTPESWQGMLDSWQAVYRAASVMSQDRVLFAFSFGPFIGFWLAFEAAAQMDCLCFSGGGLNSATRLRMLAENELTILCCTPTYALRLAEVAARERIDLTQVKVRKIIVAGEPGGSIPATRERIETAWPTATVFDHHGMTEVGPVTHEWPAARNNLQVIEDAYLAEVLKPGTNEPVAEGEEGELILTTLTRTAMPLLRYRTGDLVKPEIHSEAFILKGGILGRVDDMLIVRGVNVYPTAFEQILRGIDQVVEYQVAITTRDKMTELFLRIEPASEADTVVLTTKIESAIRAALSLRVSVEMVPLGTLPRFELKAQRWVHE